jgi:hypothetical protein
MLKASLAEIAKDAKLNADLLVRVFNIFTPGEKQISINVKNSGVSRKAAKVAKKPKASFPRRRESRTSEKKSLDPR